MPTARQARRPVLLLRDRIVPMLRRLAPILLFAYACLLPAAEPTLPVPANLTAEQIPAIPVSLMEELGPYTEFRTANLVDWHPTRREILISTDRKSTRLNSSHLGISYAVFCLKK